MYLNLTSVEVDSDLPFSMPSDVSGGVGNFWYSWNHGMVHFVQFNTETDFPDAPDEPGGEGAEFAGPFAPSGAQLAWLAKDLAAVDRNKTPWVIAAGHRPWYVSTTEVSQNYTFFFRIVSINDHEIEPDRIITDLRSQ